jgi:hypothetical protein
VAIAEIGPTSGEAKITLEQGATFDHTLTWTAGGTPVDLTGYTARMQIREEFDSADPVVSLTSSPAAGLTLGGTAGTIRIVITDEQTAALTIEAGVVDLEVQAPSGSVRKVLRGKVAVIKEVTK